jgi:alpha-L-fucosidase
MSGEAMMRKIFIGLLMSAFVFAWACPDLLVAGEAPYQPRWESLTKHPDPAWFDDAKFGIYFHWGVYAVPAFGNEWYPRNMYQKGSAENKHHLQKYGPLSTFGYKDFIAAFKAEKFDPDEWAELFEKAGAKFAGPVAEHADGFAMWASALAEWNAARLGPKRDVVGEMARAIRRRNMKFIATFHHQWLWGWYPTSDPAADASNPAYAGLYGPANPPTAFDYANPKPRPTAEFCRAWEGKVKEVIDKYQPDLIWFDSRLSIIDEAYRTDLLAYYYNQARRWGREVAVTYKGTDLPRGAGIVDLERGRMAKKTDFKWLNDDSIDWKSWGYVEDASYKSVDRLVDELVDIVSKNGNLLLNIGPKADGTIPEPIKERLLGIGAWLKLNGEAIYGTRPWEIFGEGPTQVTEGHFGEEKIKDFTAEDIRFTTKRSVLYAICLAWPEKQMVVKSLAADRKLPFGEIGEVRMLGVEKPLKWSRDEKGLSVEMPPTQPCDHAVVLKITGK